MGEGPSMFSNERLGINESELKEIGYVIGESTPSMVIMLSKEPPRLGEFVIVSHDEDYLLGMVEESIAGNPFIPENMTNLGSFETWRNVVEARNYMRGAIRILTKITPLLEGKRFDPARTPPNPSSKVFRASDEILRKIFLPSGMQEEAPYYYSPSERRGYVRIGVLANHPNVPVYVNVDSLVSRHAAILAVTGAGKSNTVSIIAERMVLGLGATVLLFDMHSEYAASGIGNDRKNVIKPVINPATLKIWELQKLAKIRDDAIKQQSVLRYVFRAAMAARERISKEDPAELPKFDVIDYMHKVLECLDILSGAEKAGKKGGKGKAGIKLVEEEAGGDEKLIGICRELPNPPRKLDREVVLNVMNKLEDLREIYEGILSEKAAKSIAEIIKPGHLNIVDLGEVDDVGSDVVASYILRRILDERKSYLRSNGSKGFPVPVFIFIEEAHILVPREGETLTKEVVGRIAREGRKFGVGICLVSQRPKSIDESSLSQTNNKIILKIVEPNDLRYVQSSSELLSDELLRMLPSLRTGEAILLGEFTKLPALVRIDMHEKKTVGRDLNVAELWMESRKGEVVPEESRREIEELMYGQGDAY